MATIEIKTAEGKKASTAELADSVFGIEPNIPVMHQVVRMQRASWRAGTHDTKTRGQVRGGGKKPWRQKGTGHARQGSTRSPQWRHGGIALGPKPRSYRYTLNKKLRRLAMKSALSAKVAEGDMIVLDAFTMDAYKTKEVAALLNAIGADRKALLVMPEKNDKVIASARNIPGVKTALVGTLNVYDIVNADKFVVVKDAVAQIEEVYC